MLSLSILYRVLRCLVGLITVLARRDLRKDAELLVLRHENTVLRRQLPHVRYTPADRMWLAALSPLLPRGRWSEIFPVTPATILNWHRTLVSRRWDYTTRRRPGASRGHRRPAGNWSSAWPPRIPAGATGAGTAS